MEKNQFYPIPFGAHAQPLLLADETEIAAKLQKKGFKVSD